MLGEQLGNRRFLVGTVFNEEHELEVVSEVQRKLLPKRLPEIPNLRLAAHYQTSRYAGGDYYDFVQPHPGWRKGQATPEPEYEFDQSVSW